MEWDCIKFSKITEAVEIIFQPSTRAISSNFVSVPFVSQGDEYAICWAACIASAVNHFKSTNYTALNIADNSVCGRNPAYDNQIVDTLNRYLMITDGAHVGTLNFQTFMQDIEGSRVSILNLQISGVGAHYVLAYGYMYNDSTGKQTLYYMEPTSGFKTTQN